MKLVQTLLVRDEIDIVDAQIAYHLDAGVDFVVAIDHESTDGTTEVLESYARDGYLRRIAETGGVKESAWRTRMARFAARDHGADWVINTDVDEFWIPRGGTLKEVLGAVPLPFGVVWGLSRHFPPRPGGEGAFAERMTVRVSSPAAISDPTSPFRPHAKVAHRADPDVYVGRGGHAARTRFAPLTHWYAAEIFHFPFRSLEQYEQKGVRGAAMSGWTRLAQYDRVVQARTEGRLGDRYRALVVDDETLAHGTREGSLVVDTRLRDALRKLPERQVASPASAAGVGDPLIGESAALRDADMVRLTRHVDELRRRLNAL